MYCTLEAAVKDFCAGKFLILVDAQERENEADLIVAAEHISGDKINRMLLEARGMLHMATTEDHLDRLGVGLIEPHNADLPRRVSVCPSTRWRALRRGFRRRTVQSRYV